MDENETLDRLDANFGPSPLRERVRALLAENAQLQESLNDANAYAVALHEQGASLLGSVPTIVVALEALDDAAYIEAINGAVRCNECGARLTDTRPICHCMNDE